MVNANLPQEIPDEIRMVLGRIVAAQEAMMKAQHWLDTARGDRDHAIAQLRVAGWTVRQIHAFTGLSVAGLDKICKQQGVQSVRTARIMPT